MQSNLVVRTDKMERRFDFDRLQFDILNEFVVMKRLIDNPRQKLRVKFFFQKKHSPESCIPPLTVVSVAEKEGTESRFWVSLKYLLIRDNPCSLRTVMPEYYCSSKYTGVDMEISSNSSSFIWFH